MAAFWIGNINKQAKSDTVEFWVSNFLRTKNHLSESSYFAYKRDMSLFMGFFLEFANSNDIELFTPRLAQAFSDRMQRDFRPSSAYRTFHTVRMFSRFLQSQRRLRWGDPFRGISHPKHAKVEKVSEITPNELASLHVACQIRIAVSRKQGRNPFLESAVFFTLLQTGLRKFELADLNLEQYREGTLYNVRRLASKVSASILAGEHLEAYLSHRKASDGEKALFVSNKGLRLDPIGIDHVLAKISHETQPKVKLSARKLRNSFLLGVAQQQGWAMAQHLSGNADASYLARRALAHNGKN